MLVPLPVLLLVAAGQVLQHVSNLLQSLPHALCAFTFMPAQQYNLF